MSEPLVSVIIPVWNVEEYLPHCIDSVLNQTYSNLEIILVDDGSPDRCGEICDEYAKKDGRIKVIHKENGGPSDARNAGLDICTGEYISFVDSDDIVSEFFIEVLLDAALKNEVEIVTLGYELLRSWNLEDITAGLSHDNQYTSQVKSSEEILEMLFYQKINSGVPFRIYKKNIWKELRFPIGWLLGEDIATIYKAFMKTDKIAIVNKLLYGCLRHSGSILHSGFSEKYMVCVDIGRQIFENIKSEKPELLYSAAHRCFSINFQVFYQVPIENKEAQKILWEEMKEYRPYILKDRNHNVRLKNRIGAWLMCLGMKNTLRISKFVLERMNR